jgi:mono/diheme cytochrome c family protein
MRPAISFICLWALTAEPSAAASLAFKSHGKLVRALSLGEMTKLVAPREIEVWEPHEGKKTAYKAFPAGELLKKVYGDELGKAEEALFTCRDGFQPSLSLSEFSAHQGFLAFAREGDPGFTLSIEGRRVEAGPFYLVWENIADASIRKRGTVPGWPYQVTTIDLIQFADRFPRMSPPAGSPAPGFLEFRKRCLSCHTVNGDGGGKGPELNDPPDPERWKQPGVARLITDPKGVNPAATMPPFERDNPEWRKDRADVLAYLEAMARAKR